jgi:subfamily B ATP-binding cassette protein MsbA
VRDVMPRFLDVERQTSAAAMVVVVVLLLVVAAARGIGAFLAVYLVQWVGGRVVLDIRKRAIDHLMQLSVGHYSQALTGEALSRTLNDSEQLQFGASNVLRDLVKQPFVLIFTLGYVFWEDWILAVCSVILFPLCLVPILSFGRRSRRAARSRQERLADLVVMLQESLYGIRVVKAFCGEEREAARFKKGAQSYFRFAMKAITAKASVAPAIIFISAIGISLALIYANRSGMAWNEFTAFLMALVLLYDPIKRLGKVHVNMQPIQASAERIFELIDTPVDVTDSPEAIEMAAAPQDIVFEDVSFRYGDSTVLRNIDLHVKAGEKIALVGASGSGKTTLVSLLLRFFDVSEGRLLMDGQDVRDYTMASIRGHIGLVTQDTFLFNNTVANNIRYGNAEASMGEVEAAARLAHAHDFVSVMEEGYETVIGEHGVRLSGGQKQRIAIARAILTNPKILVLDEATSALDTESERQVQMALDEATSGRTVFAIAHRLSTIKHCDRILVMDDGHIVETGTHDELIANSQTYKRLHDLQFGVS